MPANEVVRRIRAVVDAVRRGDTCLRCGAHVNPLLHVLYPWFCGTQPPLGGWHEPHNDEL